MDCVLPSAITLAFDSSEAIITNPAQFIHSLLLA